MSELVSVVMATYNGAKYVGQQVESVLKQTYENLELVIVDDASSDDTVAILEAFAQRDPRVKVHRAERNRGVVATFEAALGLAKGQYIALSDQDDIFEPTKIAKQVEALKTAPYPDLVLSDLRLIDANNKEIAPSMWRYQKLKVRDGHPFNQLLYANFATGCAVMIHRRLLDVALPFPPGVYMHDWWLAVTAARSDGGGIKLLWNSQTNYRQHGKNVLGAHSGSAGAAYRRVPTLEARTKWYAQNEKRIAGYLERAFWCEADRARIRDAHGLFQGYTADPKAGFFSRLGELPKRLSYARTQNLVHLLGITALTVYPKLVENVIGRSE